jgi:Zn-finger nucleic acid-binding protein
METPTPRPVRPQIGCPTCHSSLVEVERSGVRIDACPQCRGVWLDRGELDRLLQLERQADEPDEDFYREMSGGRPAERERPEIPRPPVRDGLTDLAKQGLGAFREHGHPQHKSKKSKRRKSLLEDLFDF